MNGDWQPSAAVAPGLRDPWGPSGGFSAWGDFSPQDLAACYPMPRWVAERIARYPQMSVGNALRDPLPVPFTAREVSDAVTEIGRLPQNRPERVCARIDPASVNIALRVLPILTSRNEGWIDLDAGRHEAPYLNRPTLPRAGVFNLTCALARLPGKPLPQVYAGMCAGTQPQRVDALLRVRDIWTTFHVPMAATQSPASSSFVMDPGRIESRQGFGPWAVRADLTGFVIETVNSQPAPYAYSLFALIGSRDIKGR